jgi:hypothetical protein
VDLLDGVASGLGFVGHRLHRARGVAAPVDPAVGPRPQRPIVSEATALPGVDALADFEAIQWLESRPEPGDLELMAALTTP